MALTLEELKAQNAAAEKAQAKPEAVAEVETDLELNQDETEDQTEETKTEGESQEGEVKEVEAWQAEDEPASKGGDKHKDLTYDDFAKMRTKLKARISEKDEEMERLKAEVQALKQGTQRPAQDVGKVPTLEGHDYDEAKYAAAMQAWVISQVSNVTKAQDTQSKQAQQQQALQSQVESHYQRAAKLVKEFTIEPDLYQSADQSFRQTVDAAFPGHGDAMTDMLIARLGEGSEKLVYSVGRNATKREVLKAKLLEDPSGLSASVYLGGILKEVSTPVKKSTKAPAPAARAEGGESASSDTSNFKRKYEKASDPQSRFDIRRAAKKAGLDTSKW